MERWRVGFRPVVIEGFEGGIGIRQTEHVALGNLKANRVDATSRLGPLSKWCWRSRWDLRYSSW
jgi:hypothetical protein